MTNDLRLVNTNTTKECLLLVMTYIALEKMGVGAAFCTPNESHIHLPETSRNNKGVSLKA